MNKVKSFKEFINESAWGDMMRRGSGEEIRTEDDVNLLDVDELTAYLRKNYMIDDPLTITRLIGNGGSIYVSLYEDTDGYNYILMYEHIDNGDRHMYLSSGVKDVSEDIFNEMKNKYKVTVLNDYDPDGHPLGNIMVEPNDGRDITNKFFIEFLDFIIERIEKPLTQKIYKKSMNESAWGDMMRRGSGEEIRKEDDINLLDKKGLYEYILSHYELTDNRYELTYGTANMCIPISIKGEEILLTYEFDEVHCYFNLNEYPKLYSLLQKKFNVEDKPDSDEELSMGFSVTEHYIISPKGECTNQFYIDVIDCIIENRYTIVRKKVNESAWGDMMRRGSGEEIRKEDDIDLIDQDQFYEYLKKHYKVDYKTFDIDSRDDWFHFIDVPFRKGESSNSCYALYLDYKKTGKEVTFSVELEKNSPEIVRKLIQKYNIVKKRSQRSFTISVLPPEGQEVTNSFYLEVLDYIIELKDTLTDPEEIIVTKI